MSNQQITFATSHGLRVGDVVSGLFRRRSRWERFVMWVCCPWRWPDAEVRQQFVITEVASETSFELVSNEDDWLDEDLP